MCHNSWAKYKTREVLEDMKGCRRKPHHMVKKEGDIGDHTSPQEVLV
jgi:hypothetical protein